LVTDELVIVGADVEPLAFVYAFDRTTGAVRWQRSFDGGVPLDVLGAGDMVFVVTRRGEPVALDLATGAERWRFSDLPRSERRPPGAPHLGRHLVVASRPGTVVALDPATGVARSRAQAAGGLYGALTQAGDCVLALSLANTLTCFADDLTAARWSAAATKEWSAFRPLALGDLVLAGNDQGELVAFRVDDGGEVFRLRAGGVVRGLGHADGIVYVGTLRGEVMAVELPPASQP
jgi:outer membrane protein assembly factor BamB